MNTIGWMGLQQQESLQLGDRIDMSLDQIPDIFGHRLIGHQCLVRQEAGICQSIGRFFGPFVVACEANGSRCELAVHG